MFVVVLGCALIITCITHRCTALSLKTTFRFLESNSWDLGVGDYNILLDPVMSQLDFGIPLLYAGNKRIIDGPRELYKLAEKSDFVLISQGFDDHAHRPTLSKLAQIAPTMKYVVAPAAKPILESCGIQSQYITTIKPGEKKVFKKRKTSMEILATNGALLGPPWQQKENGYIVRPTKDSEAIFPSFYYEPHCMYDENEVKQYSVEAVITPVVSQELPAYTLVAGGEKALKLAQLMNAKYILPMANGNLEQSGILSSIINAVGSEDDFVQLVKKSGSNLQVLSAPAGKLVSLP